MIYLVQYDPSKSKLISFRSFEDADREEAFRLRLDLELECARVGLDHEIVILDAASESDLRDTHCRYFDVDLAEKSRQNFMTVRRP